MNFKDKQKFAILKHDMEDMLNIMMIFAKGMDALVTRIELLEETEKKRGDRIWTPSK